MKLLHISLLAVIIFFSCKKDDLPAPNNQVPMGTLTGKVVAKNNTTPVRNAIVFISYNGQIYHSFTNVNGEFTLSAPAGHRELNIQSGTGSIFRTTMTIYVEENSTTQISGSVVLNQVANLAYLPGAYDKIEAILIDSLGYSATMINNATLHSVAAMSPFNAVFINCSSNITTDPVQDSVLATYVANGGSLYVSDYAVAAIIGAYTGPCPGFRPGGFIHDSTLCTQRIGNTGMVYAAPIISQSLQTYLNKFYMDITYNLGSWETVMNYDSTFWERMIMHPSGISPLLIRTANFTNGSAGTVNIGTASTSNMVTICHQQQGSAPVTITIPSADLATHLAHGDTMGSCNSANGAGRVYYTTFHNHPNGIISPDMKHILDYIILNL